MIVVFDSSVWISALEYHGVPEQALAKALTEDQIAYSDAIQAEVEQILIRKMGWNPERFATTFLLYLQRCQRVATRGEVTGVCRDPSDDKVIECAMNSGADIIVTGDRDLLDLGSYSCIRFLTPREYIDLR